MSPTARASLLKTALGFLRPVELVSALPGASLWNVDPANICSLNRLPDRDVLLARGWVPIPERAIASNRHGSVLSWSADFQLQRPRSRHRVRHHRRPHPLARLGAAEILARERATIGAVAAFVAQPELHGLARGSLRALGRSGGRRDTVSALSRHLTRRRDRRRSFSRCAGGVVKLSS